MAERDDNKKSDRSEHVTLPLLRLGLKPNINQSLLLILVNAFVGAMIGLEQTVAPLLGKEEFGLESNVLPHVLRWCDFPAKTIFLCYLFFEANSKRVHTM